MMAGLHRYELEDLGALASRNALRMPDVLAYASFGGSLTWSELDSRAAAFAKVMIDSGMPPGCRVAILGSGLELDWPVIQHAVWKAGGVIASVHGTLPDRLLVPQLKSADVKILIGGEKFDGERLRSLASLIGARQLYSWAGASGVPDVAEVSAGYDSEDPPRRQEAGDVSVIFFSSGTTGVPKGIAHTHHSVLAGAFNHIAARGLTMQDTTVNWSPFYFSGGQLFNLIVPGYLGQGTAILPRFSVDGAERAFKQFGVNVFWAVPTIIRAFAQDPQARSFPEITQVLAAGAPLTQDLINDFPRTFPNASLLNMGGLSEMEGGTVMDPRDRTPGRLTSVGRPGVGVQVRVVTDDGRDAKPDEKGEIWYRSDGHFAGYIGEPELTAETLTEDGWVKSGDVGHFDEDRFLYLTDRKKQIIITGGVNVYPTEVESVLYELSDVLECAVVGMPNDRWGEAVTAVLVVKAGSALDANAVIAYCRGNLGAHQVPKLVLITDQLPKTAVGKIDRTAITQHYSEVRTSQ